MKRTKRPGPKPKPRPPKRRRLTGKETAARHALRTFEHYVAHRALAADAFEAEATLRALMPRNPFSGINRHLALAWRTETRRLIETRWNVTLPDGRHERLRHWRPPTRPIPESAIMPAMRDWARARNLTA